jgi:hypothetical protein
MVELEKGASRLAPQLRDLPWRAVPGVGLCSRSRKNVGNIEGLCIVAISRIFCFRNVGISKLGYLHGF